eukprot:TRINITY_DN36102_c0_g1_i2.p1 TRINITY_DN36102_c0_g1~~TRINITY_DN36102_c0_g1_i2.p1  ORF type:complete len:355 (+),score=130.38 TRINITY_DN36102_c0_g1_i2:32-1066(+)
MRRYAQRCVAAWHSGAVQARGYKQVVNPQSITSPPDMQRDRNRVMDAVAGERKENAEAERQQPQDPTAYFLQQGRHMLAHIEDGGDIILNKETGVQGVFAIELSNQEKENCVTAHMMCRLEEVIREINQHPECVAVIVRGVGVQFCSGASPELATRHLLAGEEGLRMCRYMQTLLLELHNLPCITVAAIEGGAVGGGAELAMACDFRVMTEKSNIHFAHTHMGISTGWGGATRLTKLVGRRAAILLLCSGKPCHPSDATSFGLADRVCPEGEAYRDAMAFVKANFLNTPSEAVKGCKDIIAAAEILSPRTALLYEQNVFAALWAKNARRSEELPNAASSGMLNK